MFVNHTNRLSASAPKGATAEAAVAAVKAPIMAPAVEAGILPWSLSAPISRSVVTAAAGGTIDIFGGLSSGGQSAPGIYALDTTTGRLTHTGDLAVPLHDAAGATLGNRFLLFGGGSPNTIAAVESISLPQATAAQIVGQMPRRRSDGEAISLGNAVYVVGGYTGSAMSPADAAVLVTADGTSFSTVARLPMPVRYPAVAALNGLIYVFGGIGAAGRPVSEIQIVNPQKGTARLAGKMPIPLEGASAAVVGGRIYLAGGATTEAAAANAGDSASGGVAASASHLVTVGTVWSYDDHSSRLEAAGRLPIPVANGAAAEIGRAHV